MIRIAAPCLALLLTGCMVHYVDPVPEGFQGDVAGINDTFEHPYTNRGFFFYVEELNGEPVRNAFVKSDRASTDTGRNLFTYGYLRDFPAGPQTLKLAARRMEAMPIAYGISNFERANGEVDLDLRPGQTYLVRGIVEEEFAAVWIEDLYGNRVTDVVESTALVAEAAGEYRARIPGRNDFSDNPSSEEAFASIRSGEHFSVVEAKIGMPDQTSATPSTGGFLAPPRPATSSYYYDGLGRVEFNNFSDSAYTTGTSGHSQPERGLSTSELEVMLDTDDAERIRSRIRSMAETRITDREMLDVAAQRLWEGRHAEDDLMVDAMAWICRLLGQSGDGRYISLLSDIAEEANSRKLERFAEANRELVSPESYEQFRPAG